MREPEESDEKRCRIFGHDCPVFYVAEPFTETKQLRSINRHISRPVQFRVLKREQQMCRECGHWVREEDIHFDHIIPFSKGGSSDEHNIRLLCGPCNLKKGASFEDLQLVNSMQDHMMPPADRGLIEFLLFVARFAHEFHADNGRYPTGEDFGNELAEGDTTDAERYWAEVVKDLMEFFSRKRPPEISARTFRALKARWGLGEHEVASLEDVASCFDCDLDDLFYADVALVQRLGFRVDVSESLKRDWIRADDRPTRNRKRGGKR